jgi:hypothetical protein
MRSTKRNYVSHDETESIQCISVVGLHHQSKMDTPIPSSASFSRAELVVRLAVAAIPNVIRTEKSNAASVVVTTNAEPGNRFDPGIKIGLVWDAKKYGEY